MAMKKQANDTKARGIQKERKPAETKNNVAALAKTKGKAPKAGVKARGK
ncbi:MAG: hypothetical protein KGL39_05030 [Patescibacteria group bacterium]|nr:hypothetical protein [Patescibacteria group bacterium]